jgi:hypothetical protein
MWRTGIAIVGACGLAAGCGYGFSPRPAYIPPEAHTISVEHFENQTPRLGVELLLAAALEDVIRERGLLRVVSEGAADLVLTGTIRSFSLARPVATSDVDQAVIYAGTMVLNVALARGADGKALWRGDGLVEIVDVPVSAGVVIPSSPTFQQGTLNARNVSNLSDIQLAEDRLSREVLRGLVDNMAQSIYSQVLEGL